jgi:hypothetical protein
MEISRKMTATIKTTRLLFIIINICMLLNCRAQGVIGSGISDETLQPEYFIDDLPVYNLVAIPGYMTNSRYYYIKDIDNHHDDIVGVWKWQDRNDFFEFTVEEFEMETYYEDTTEYHDRLYGKYKYVVNNNIISEVSQIESWPSMKLIFFYESPTEYKVMIKDIVSDTHKVGQFIFTSPTTATMVLRNSEGVKINYGNGQDFALPTNLVLTKID